MSKATAANAAYEPIQWEAAWIEESSILRVPELQPRSKGTVPATVQKYRDLGERGQEFPPIKVAQLPNGTFVLVDGWHRMEADVVERDPLSNSKVNVLLASMSDARAAWEAASANLAHGEPLRKREDLQRVFKAFVRAKRHLPKGRFMGYREMAKAVPIGMSHDTMNKWMKKFFPTQYAKLGGSPARSEGGLMTESDPVAFFAAQQRALILDGLQQAGAALPSLTPSARWELREALRGLLVQLESHAVEEPQF